MPPKKNNATKKANHTIDIGFISILPSTDLPTPNTALIALLIKIYTS